MLNILVATLLVLAIVGILGGLLIVIWFELVPEVLDGWRARRRIRKERKGE